MSWPRWSLFRDVLEGIFSICFLAGLSFDHGKNRTIATYQPVANMAMKPQESSKPMMENKNGAV